MKRFSVYLAHPISGLTPGQVFDYYDTMKEVFSDLGYDVLSPMVAKDYFRTQDSKFVSYGYDNPISGDQSIVARDSWMVSQADIIYVDFTGSEKISIGCVSEIAWAWSQRKYIVAVLPEYNVHRHAFITEMAGTIFSNSSDAVAYFKELVGEK